jgi:hypothetical protein
MFELFDGHEVTPREKRRHCLGLWLLLGAICAGVLLYYGG